MALHRAAVFPLHPIWFGAQTRCTHAAGGPAAQYCTALQESVKVEDSPSAAQVRTSPLRQKVEPGVHGCSTQVAFTQRSWPHDVPPGR
jgi:hypothetical protein